MALLSRPNVATVAIVSALVVLSGTGGAVAGSMITGQQIKDGTVTGADVRNGSLAGSDIKDGSVAAADLTPSVRSRLNMPPTLQVVRDTTPQPVANTYTNLTATCPQGLVVTAAAAWWGSSNEAVQVAVAQNLSSAAGYSAGVPIAGDDMVVQVTCGKANVVTP